MCLTHLNNLELWLQKGTGRTIKCLRTDNGGEFTSLKFENIAKTKGFPKIKQMYTLNRMVL